MKINEDQLENAREMFIDPKKREEEMKLEVLSGSSWIFEDGIFTRHGIQYEKMLFHKKS